MLGGIGASLQVLQPLVDAIDPSIEVVRIDPPGIGGSPARSIPYSMAELACELDQLLDGLGYLEVDVMGFSWGGALAQQFAWQHQRRCRRLILVSSSSGAISVPGDPSALTRMLLPHRLSTAEEAQALLDGDVSLVSDLSQEITRNPVGYYHQLAAIAAWSSLPLLWMIRQSTLVASGQEDRLVPVANAHLLTTMLPSATLALFPGGHGMIIASAAELARRISTFVTAPHVSSRAA